MQYLTSCRTCGGKTNKKYAREHAGECKRCAEPESVSTVYGRNNARVLEAGYSAYAREEGHYE
jgi:hypothetical protein